MAQTGCSRKIDRRPYRGGSGFHDFHFCYQTMQNRLLKNSYAKIKTSLQHYLLAYVQAFVKHLQHGHRRKIISPWSIYRLLVTPDMQSKSAGRFRHGHVTSHRPALISPSIRQWVRTSGSSRHAVQLRPRLPTATRTRYRETYRAQ